MYILMFPIVSFSHIVRNNSVRTETVGGSALLGQKCWGTYALTNVDRTRSTTSHRQLVSQRLKRREYSPIAKYKFSHLFYLLKSKGYSALKRCRVLYRWCKYIIYTGLLLFLCLSIVHPYESYVRLSGVSENCLHLIVTSAYMCISFCCRWKDNRNTVFFWNLVYYL